MMHAECEQAKKTMKEANRMKSEVCMMKRLASCPVLWCMRVHMYCLVLHLYYSLKEILDSTRDDAESILKSYSSPGQLATFAVALKRWAPFLYCQLMLMWYNSKCFALLQ